MSVGVPELFLTDAGIRMHHRLRTPTPSSTIVFLCSGILVSAEWRSIGRTRAARVGLGGKRVGRLQTSTDLNAAYMCVLSGVCGDSRL
jgi:hypothetical protein